MKEARLFLLLAGLVLGPTSWAGVFIFAEDQKIVDLIAHPTGYTGSQNSLTVSVCIDPNSESIDQMEIPVRNAISVWNELTPVLGNLRLNNPEVPSNHFDYESVMLHEIGHCIGLAHPNLASESGLSSTGRRYAKALKGPNDVYDVSAGADGIIGTRDDLRADDINLGWFRKGVNSPFLYEDVIDASTYGVDLNDLPAGHNFVEIAALQVAQFRNLPDGEAVMHQGTRARATRRDLSPDDATMLRIGMSGRDRTQGSSDDYTLTLEYGGIAGDCDITVRTEGSGFGVCGVSGRFISQNGKHIQITSGDITLGSASNINWHFNQVLRDAASYSVGGSITGLEGSGLVLQNNGGDELVIDANGDFVFSENLPDGQSYSVTVLTAPSDPDQTCTVLDGSGTIAGANVTTVQINCESLGIFHDRFEQNN